VHRLHYRSRSRSGIDLAVKQRWGSASTRTEGTPGVENNRCGQTCCAAKLSGDGVLGNRYRNPAFFDCGPHSQAAPSAATAAGESVFELAGKQAECGENPVLAGPALAGREFLQNQEKYVVDFAASNKKTAAIPRGLTSWNSCSGRPRMCMNDDFRPEDICSLFQFIYPIN
jgi:hypothetical protein